VSYPHPGAVNGTSWERHCWRTATVDASAFDGESQRLRSNDVDGDRRHSRLRRQGTGGAEVPSEGPHCSFA
jgi:hypothetical protein